MAPPPRPKLCYPRPTPPKPWPEPCHFMPNSSPMRCQAKPKLRIREHHALKSLLSLPSLLPRPTYSHGPACSRQAAHSHGLACSRGLAYSRGLACSRGPACSHGIPSSPNRSKISSIIPASNL
ncbi:hypothetical protein ACFX2J_025341 [Malus domestica]